MSETPKNNPEAKITKTEVKIDCPNCGLNAVKTTWTTVIPKMGTFTVWAIDCSNCHFHQESPAVGGTRSTPS